MNSLYARAQSRARRWRATRAEQARRKSLIPVAIERYRSGHTLAEISADLNITVAFLRHHLRDVLVLADKTFNSVGAQPADIEPSLRKHIYVARQYRSGRKLSEIASELGVTVTSARNWLNEISAFELDILMLESHVLYTRYLRHLSGASRIPPESRGSYARYWSSVVTDGQTYLFLDEAPDCPFALVQDINGEMSSAFAVPINPSHPYCGGVKRFRLSEAQSRRFLAKN